MLRLSLRLASVLRWAGRTFRPQADRGTDPGDAWGLANGSAVGCTPPIDYH